MSSMLGNLETKVVVSGALFPMGTKGYSAYEIAVQQGFKGTVDEWLQTLTGPQGPQGPMGPSNIYVGDEEPTDKNINVWFDTNEEADIPTGGVVEEIDPTVPSHVKAITQADINKWNNNSGGGSSSSGLTTNERNTLIEVINAIGVFNVANGQELIDNFNNAWRGGGTETPEPTYYSIIRNLNNAISTSSISTIKEGSSHTETITANNGYLIDNVTVTMGGNDITSSVYHNGVINIYNVTGNITITVTTTKEELETPTNGVVQTGSTLAIVSDVIVTQNNSNLIIR